LGARPKEDLKILPKCQNSCLQPIALPNEVFFRYLLTDRYSCEVGVDTIAAQCHRNWRITLSRKLLRAGRGAPFIDSGNRLSPALTLWAGVPSLCRNQL